MGPDKLRRAVRLLQAGDWQTAHQIVQQDEASRLACWAHGIVHLMEGDVSNARYWYGQARRAFPDQPSIPHEIAALEKESGSDPE